MRSASRTHMPLLQLQVEEKYIDNEEPFKIQYNHKLQLKIMKNSGPSCLL